MFRSELSVQYYCDVYLLSFVRGSDKKLTMPLQDLLNQAQHTRPSSSEHRAALRFYMLQENEENESYVEPNGSVFFGPSPSYGQSILDPSLGYKFESNKCYRILCPIYLPVGFINEKVGAAAECGVLQGYVLCESQRHLGPDDVVSVLGVAKLAAFVALAETRR